MPASSEALDRLSAVEEHHPLLRGSAPYAARVGGGLGDALEKRGLS